MKVCPVCGSRFEETETFCPHDGARLELAHDYAPGQLVGETIGGSYTLDRLIFTDVVGERYEGTSAGGTRVRVTVFSEIATPEPDRAAALESTRALIGDAPPLAIGRLLDYDLDADPAWVVEHHAPGEPFSRGGDAMRWEHALETINHAARAIEWLHRAGVTHRALQPGAITRAEDGAVTVFEWAHGVLLNQNNVMELAALGDFVAYPSYIAPELTRPSKKPNQKTAVFALGAMAYEAISGRALSVDEDAEAVLKRHRRERLLGLSLAAPDVDLPQGFDDVFGLVIDRSPKRRFQALGAMVNALSGLLGDDPDASFPQLDVEDPDPSVDDASTDTEQMDMSVLDEDKSRYKRKPGSPEPKKKRRRRKSQEAPTAKVVVDDALTESSASGAVSGSSETSDSDGAPTERPKRKRRRTRPDGAEAIDGKDRPRRKKRRRTRPDGEAAVDRPEGEDRPRRKRDAKADEAKGEERPRRKKRRRTRPDGEPAVARKTAPDTDDAPPAKGDAADKSEKPETSEKTKGSAQAPERKRRRSKRRPSESRDGEPRRKKRREAPVDPTPQRDSAESKKPRRKKTKPKVETVERAPAAASAASSSGEAIFDDSWFSNDSTEKAWDENYLLEHKNSQEQRYNRMIFVAGIALIIAVIVFTIYSMTYEDPPEEESSLDVHAPTYALTLPHHPGPTT